MTPKRRRLAKGRVVAGSPVSTAKPGAATALLARNETLTAVGSRPTDVAISRHTTGGRFRMTATLERLSTWSRAAGTPFGVGTIFVPDAPGSDPSVVRYGPFALERSIDRLVVFAGCTGPREHGNQLALEVQFGDSGAEASGTGVYSFGDRRPVVVEVPMRESESATIEFRAWFHDKSDESAWGSLEIEYVLALAGNELLDLFDATGSDKGSVHRAGNGVPHCYGLVYHPLLEHLRDESINLLEIGLDNASKESGQPAGAPSLAAWRRYFPKAALYGFDRNDFSFLDLVGTSTFQGDQGERDDLRRFLKAHDVEFDVVVDDGSHAPSDQQVSLATLFVAVAPGGYYVIEDADWQPGEEEPTTLAMLRAFTEGASIATPFMTKDECQYLEDTIAGVSFHRPNDSHIIVIRKNGS